MLLLLYSVVVKLNTSFKAGTQSICTAGFAVAIAAFHSFIIELAE